MTALVFLDPAFPAGRIADATTPQLSVLDQGVTRGDGGFESVLYTGSVVRKIQARRARLRVSAETGGLRLPEGRAWRAAIAPGVGGFEGRPPYDEPVVKLVATRGTGGT